MNKVPDKETLRPQLGLPFPWLLEQGRTRVVGTGLLPLTCKSSHKKDAKGGPSGMAEGDSSEGLRKCEHPLGKNAMAAKGLGLV